MQSLQYCAPGRGGPRSPIHSGHAPTAASFEVLISSAIEPQPVFFTYSSESRAIVWPSSWAAVFGAVACAVGYHDMLAAKEGEDLVLVFA